MLLSNPLLHRVTLSFACPFCPSQETQQPSSLFYLGLRFLLLLQGSACPRNHKEQEKGCSPKSRIALRLQRPRRVGLWERSSRTVVLNFQELAERLPAILYTVFEQLVRRNNLADTPIVFFITRNRIFFDTLVLWKC